MSTFVEFNADMVHFGPHKKKGGSGVRTVVHGVPQLVREYPNWHPWPGSQARGSGGVRCPPRGITVVGGPQKFEGRVSCDCQRSGSPWSRPASVTWSSRATAWGKQPLRWVAGGDPAASGVLLRLWSPVRGEYGAQVLGGDNQLYATRGQHWRVILKS